MLFIWQNVQTTPDPLQKIPTSCCSTDLVDQVASGKGNILRIGRVKMP